MDHIVILGQIVFACGPSPRTKLRSVASHTGALVMVDQQGLVVVRDDRVRSAGKD
jgi:hypothetical protein